MKTEDLKKLRMTGLIWIHEDWWVSKMEELLPGSYPKIFKVVFEKRFQKKKIWQRRAVYITEPQMDQFKKQWMTNEQIFQKALEIEDEKFNTWFKKRTIGFDPIRVEDEHAIDALRYSLMSFKRESEVKKAWKTIFKSCRDYIISRLDFFIGYILGCIVSYFIF